MKNRKKKKEEEEEECMNVTHHATESDFQLPDFSKENQKQFPMLCFSHSQKLYTRSSLN
jgi:hypothetical protein